MSYSFLFVNADTVIGPSCVTYVKIDLESMKKMRKKNTENKGMTTALLRCLFSCFLINA